jgi:hypothetical protein
MFQCIIQQRNGWIRNSPELKDVFPGKREQTVQLLLLIWGSDSDDSPFTAM